ncbi:MAG: hypothetical protein WED34_14140 [Planctomycetales bacterium]
MPFAVGLLSMVLGIIGGIGIDRFGLQHGSVPMIAEGPEPEPPRLSEERRESSRLALTGEALEHHLRLAVAASRPAKLRALSDLGETLWHHAKSRVGDGPSEDLLLVSELYRRVVDNGLAETAGTLAADERRELTPIIARLRTTESEARHLADSAMPATADILLRIAASSAGSAEILERGRSAPPSPRTPLAGGDLLSAVVLQSVHFIDEPDPLERADGLNDLAEQMAQRIVFHAARGESDEAAFIERQLESIFVRGVEENLKQAEQSDDQAGRRTDLERVRQRTGRVESILERNLTHVPERARPGLERALQAVRKHGAGHPHPDRGPPGPDFIPPGLRKAKPSGEEPSRTPPGRSREPGKVDESREQSL